MFTRSNHPDLEENPSACTRKWRAKLWARDKKEAD